LAFLEINVTIGRSTLVLQTNVLPSLPGQAALWEITIFPQGTKETMERTALSVTTQRTYYSKKKQMKK
jgi:hypothetical protein